MNYYELLGISNSASEEEIKMAYKAQMKKWHPDINKDEEAVSMSMKINEAKETLLDSVKRREYDEFLKQKKENVYQKYSNQKTNDYRDKEYSYQDNYDEYETQMMTKWEYLREYLRSSNISKIRKILVCILVLLESLLCTALKYLIISVSFICFFLSNIILYTFYYLFPLVVLFFGYLLYIVFTSDINNLFYNHTKEVTLFAILTGIYVFSFILPILSRKLISPKVFDFLYNKLDINLFKLIVGYK